MRRPAVAGALAATVLLAGCSDDSPPSDATSSKFISSGATSAPTSLGSGLGSLHPTRLTVAAGASPGAARGRSLDLPAGWTAQVWADVPSARLAAWAPDGRLVVSTGQRGDLMLLTPSGGRTPQVHTLAAGLQDPQGLAFARRDGRDVLVVGEGTRITTYAYAGGRLTDRRVLVDDLPTGGHGNKAVAVHGDQVFYSVGSASNRDPADRTGSPARAIIAQVGLDGSGNHTVATGVRNGFGLDIAPDGTLVTAVNQSDDQPYPFRDATKRFGTTVRGYVNENPVDQVARITAGTDLGWPLCFPDTRGKRELTQLPYVRDAEHNADGRALDCGRIGRTMLGLPAHSAPLGLTFTRGAGLPRSVGDGAFIAAHGSWDRQPPREPYVAYAAWDERTKTLGPASAYVTGWQNADGSRWGRAVDAVPGLDHAVYVTDDQAGLIYRLTAPGAG